jgi:hypothetical protein
MLVGEVVIVTVKVAPQDPLGKTAIPVSATLKRTISLILVAIVSDLPSNLGV